MLIGLKEIHNSRCMKLWDVFETMVKDDCFKSDERNRFLDDDAKQGKFWPSKEIEEY